MLLERFLRYVKIDTQSDPESKTCPSTQKQFSLAKFLANELSDLGLEKVKMDNNGYVTALLPSNSKKNIPTIGFLAHIDTSPDFSGKDVKPQIIEEYDGNNIVLNKEQQIIMKVDDFPELKLYKGQKLITTDGTTLLGADNKAGIAEIITAIDYLLQHPEIEHGNIRVGFTPDEEIGRGANKFDVESFNADFAYTIDGGQIGELEFETFNAAFAQVEICGRNVHPGEAKNKMINASLIAMDFNNCLPLEQRPEYTSGYEGFFHLMKINGDVENVKMQYIIRDHAKNKFEHKKELFEQTANLINKKYQNEIVKIELTDQYYNMSEKIKPVFHIVELAEKAMKQVGVTPIKKPVRGGTDGARLSYMGLPTPNIFTGGHNFHGKFEFIPLQSMEKAVEVIVKIIELSAKNNV